MLKRVFWINKCKSILVALSLCIGYCNASDCIKLSKTEIYNFADGVFLGQVFEVMDTTFSVKLIETYKGSYPDTLTGIINQNVVPPEKGSTWLFYSTDLGRNTFIADACSGSKSFSFPHGAHDIAYLVPPPPEILRAPAQMFVLEQVLKDKALNEMYFEISGLRKNKLEERLMKLEADNTRLNDQLVQMNQYYEIILVLTGLIIVLQIFIRIRHFRK